MPKLNQILWLLVSFTLLLKGIRAEGLQVYIKPGPHNCVEGVNDAISMVTFGDISPDATYYGGMCTSPLRLTSLALSTMKYCQSKEFQDRGWERINGYCTKYGDTTLPSWDDILSVVNQSNIIEDVNVVDPAIIGTVYNSTIILSQEAFDAGYKTEIDWQHEMIYHHAFGWCMYILVGLAVLVGAFNRCFAVFVQRYAIPSYTAEAVSPSSKGFKGRWYTLWRKHVEIPALFGYKHSQACAWGWLSVPTRIQGLFIFVYVALNIVFTSVGYTSFYESVYWYGHRDTQLIRYLSDRTGIMCFYNLPLLWCLAGRNDIILWMTGWSYSTLNLFHRWVARIAVLQAIVHSAGYTYLERDILAEEFAQRYWWTGVIATIVMSLLVPLSVRPIRERFYEIFLIIHITFALITLVTLWYHVEVFDGEYYPWIYACIAVWCLDRFIRIVRVLILTYKALSKTGKNTIATISGNAGTAVNQLGRGLIRLSITTSTKINPQPGQYYFIYTPFSMKPWENHPFTLASWRQNQNETTLDFLIAPLSGATKRWQKKVLLQSTQVQQNGVSSGEKQIELRLLLEGPYGHTNPIQNYDKVLLISGGSGITSSLPYLHKLKMIGIELPEPTVKLITLIWIIKKKEYTSDVLSFELKEYIEYGSVGGIPFQLELYVTRDNENEKSEDKLQDDHQVMNGLGYDETQGSPSSLGSGDSPETTRDSMMEKLKCELETEKSSQSSSTDLTANIHKKSSNSNVLTVHSGRPQIRDLIDDSVERLIGGERLAISACGPYKMMDDARATVCDIYGNAEGQVKGGRIEYFEELFAW
ncbi:uncharacterized protein IL334_002627 [Kwoniella shivajii]|uniref:FAD-binding FR-type domain-containing protein n=1 Tax=Kwoniella shivajii TaxID=564305 RepID=A0ABZ1CZG1_9TREE|nr:hypothetical protein IL334_002627 [Kwoniella shivajii]